MYTCHRDKPSTDEPAGLDMRPKYSVVLTTRWLWLPGNSSKKDLSKHDAHQLRIVSIPKMFPTTMISNNQDYTSWGFSFECWFSRWNFCQTELLKNIELIKNFDWQSFLDLYDPSYCFKCLRSSLLDMTGQKPGRILRGFAKRIGEGARNSILVVRECCRGLVFHHLHAPGHLAQNTTMTANMTRQFNISNAYIFLNIYGPALITPNLAKS